VVSAAIPGHLKRAIVVAPLHCTRCGYNLRGVPVDHRCPECGLEVWATVTHVVDPTASSLPRLRNPRGVGDALVWLMMCLFVVAAAMILAPTSRQIARSIGADWLSALSPEVLYPVAALASLGGLWSVYQFSLPRRSESGDVAHRLWLTGGGLVGMALCTGTLWFREIIWTQPAAAPTVEEVAVWRVALRAVTAGSAIAVLYGVSGILKAIGLRSRAYRTARGGRQSIRAMTAAIVCVIFGEGMRLAGVLRFDPDLRDIGRMAGFASMLMVLIGLLYLIVNVWWIRAAIRRPPPRLSEIVALEKVDAPE
jgi:hypothetical protein